MDGQSSTTGSEFKSKSMPEQETGQKNTSRTNLGEINSTDGISLSQLDSVLWSSFCRFVARNRVAFEFANEASERLLFWMSPYYNNDSTTDLGMSDTGVIGGTNNVLREIFSGLLSLNRLAVECATGPILNSYGTSQQTVKPPTIAASGIRLTLSILQALLPSLLEAATANRWPTIDNSVHGNNHIQFQRRQRRQSLLRKRLEQIKFGLRLYLLGSYWRQLRQEQTITTMVRDTSSSGMTMMKPGMLLDGGLFHSGQPEGMSVDQSIASQQRLQYIGRRTGLQLSTNAPTLRDSQSSRYIQLISSVFSTKEGHTSWRIVVGELLHALRPLYWASAESQYHTTNDGKQTPFQLMKSLLIALAMDMVSLGVLQESLGTTTNSLSKLELSRRKWNLFFYLLRDPVWSKLTVPSIDCISKCLRKIPFGRFLDAYLLEWILHSKHPFVSEEG